MTDEQLPKASEDGPFFRWQIGILTLNGDALLQACLASIIEHTCHRKDWTVFVIDDGSEEQSLRALRQIVPFFEMEAQERGCDGPMFQMAEGRANLGIPDRWNHLAMSEWTAGFQAQTPYLAFLNNDVQVCPGWLEALEYAIKNNDAGMVCLNQKPTSIHEGGEGVTVRPASSGFCFATTRTIYETVGPFDANYFNFFEDKDWGIRCWRKGLGCFDIPPEIDHKVGETFRQNERVLRPDMRMKLSRRLFRQKYADGLEDVRQAIESWAKRPFKYLLDGKELECYPQKADMEVLDVV